MSEHVSFFTGEQAQSEQARRHVEQCKQCRRSLHLHERLGTAMREVDPAIAELSIVDAVARSTYQSQERIRQALQQVDAEIRDVDLGPAVRRATREHAAMPWWQRSRSFLIGGSAAVAAAAAILFAVRPDTPTEEGFRAKSGIATAQFTGITPYLVRGNRVSFLTDSMPHNGALSFTYSNDGEKPWPHLMIFGIQKGEIFWYYPEGGGASAGQALTIATRVRGQELPDRVDHALEPGEFALFGLFTRPRLTTQDVENAVQRAGGTITEQHIPGSYLQRISVSVR